MGWCLDAHQVGFLKSTALFCSTRATETPILRPRWNSFADDGSGSHRSRAAARPGSLTPLAIADRERPLTRTIPGLSAELVASPSQRSSARGLRHRDRHSWQRARVPLSQRLPDLRMVRTGRIEARQAVLTVSRSATPLCLRLAQARRESVGRPALKLPSHSAQLPLNCPSPNSSVVTLECYQLHFVDLGFQTPSTTRSDSLFHEQPRRFIFSEPT